jgi:drug/metabolite transporter (DMT)-like permease
MQVPQSEQRKAAAALATLCLVWGCNFVLMKLGLGDSRPFQFATLRFLVAAACMVPVIAWYRESLLPRGPQWRAVTILGLALAANFGCTLYGLSLGGTGKTAVLVYTMPFWVLVFARLFLKETLSRWQGLAVVLALAGLVVLVRPWRFTGELVASALAVGAGMTWGASVIYVKRLQRKTAISMLMITLWQMVIGSLTLGLAWLWFEPQPVRWSAAFVACVLYSAIPATGMAWLLFYYALKRMPAGLVGLGTLATPVVGVLAAWLLMGEKPSAIEAFGMAFIGIALAMLAWNPFERRAG